MSSLQSSASRIPFVAGVVEGFYGKPWTRPERLRLFDWMRDGRLNTYMYAPKDDLKHRAIWRENYDSDELEGLSDLIAACRTRGLEFIYALSPGLDIRYRDSRDLERLSRRFEQLMATGCVHFALLFDDIAGHLDPGDFQATNSLASAQSGVSNQVYAWTRKRAPAGRFLFCPTPYCGRMAERGHGGAGYLETIGRELHPGIDVLWTGPEIISEEISVTHLQTLETLLRRKPVIWDNLHANDYDARRFFCGPYSGRPPEVREHLNGILANPNCELPLNFVAVRTLAEFIHHESCWDGRRAYLDALAEWLPQFKTVHGAMTLEDLVVFADCYYLPHQAGPEAEALYLELKTLVMSRTISPEDRAKLTLRARRLRDFCGRLPDLCDRPLFHALMRRGWELREELELLLGYAERHTGADEPVVSDFHLPKTYRGGLVARLQHLLVQHPDGTFTPAPGPDED